ncbi:MAG: hypothetical protein L6R41_001927 [Letrouitia leprolyta]|nr:MAG: hypothetical protein L6R41_001927 [Letrouitia leprolyta]
MSKPHEPRFSFPSQTAPTNDTTSAPNNGTSSPPNPAGNQHVVPASDPSTTTSAATPSPFLPLSIGFPRIIDVATFSPDAFPVSNLAIPDLVVTVLYNYDLTHGKEALAAFLNFVYTEFCFVCSVPSQSQFHIEREKDIVLVSLLDTRKIPLMEVLFQAQSAHCRIMLTGDMT